MSNNCLNKGTNGNQFARWKWAVSNPEYSHNSDEGVQKNCWWCRHEGILSKNHLMNLSLKKN